MFGLSVFCFRFVQLSFAALSATPVHTGKNNTGSGNGTATSLVVTVTAPAAGNWCTLVISSSLVRAVTITQTNVSWTSYPVYNSTGAFLGVLAYGRAFASAGTTVTIAIADGTAFNAAAVYAEWQQAGNIALDRRAGATGNSVNAASGATATIDTAAELMIGGFYSRGTFSAPTTIFTAPGQSGTATGGTVSVVDQDNTITNASQADRVVAMTVQLTTSTGTVNAVATTTPTNQWGAQVMTFEENACTPTPTSTPTSTATATFTPTATATSTATATPSATINCPVVCPTATFTPTATATSTATPTNTPTPTATGTATSTPTPIINNVIYGQ